MQRRTPVSGMSRRWVSTGAIAVSLALTPTAALAQPASDPDADSGQDNSTIIVTGTQLKSEASVSRNALGKDEQARSIQVYDDALIDEIKPEGLEDVVALSANVTFDGSNDGRESSFIIRGFGGAPVLRDGFRVTSFGGVSDPEVFNLESIEVLKGPDSILYGESNPGGLINLRTKRPLRQDRTFVGVEAGTDISLSPRFDINRSFGDAAARIVGLYRYDESFAAYENANRTYSLVPTFRWDSGTGTVVTLLGEVVIEDVYADFGTALGNDGKLTAPISQVNNHPQDTLRREYYSGGIDLEQRLTTDLTAEARVRYIDSSYNYSVILLPVAYNDTTKTYVRVPADQENRNKEWAAQANLFGDFTIAGLRDRFTLGVDYRTSDTAGSTLFSPTSVYLLDWANPDYSRRPPARSTLGAFPGFGDKVDRVGVFLQNHLNLTDALLLSAGVRYDKVDSTPATGSSSTPFDADNTSVQFGARYKLAEAFAPYANYSESFRPNTARDSSNNLLPPESGEGWEVGAKGRLFGERLSYTAAYFEITKTNVALGDPANPFASIASGRQRSRGAEIDVSGKLTRRWSVIASLGLTRTKDQTGFRLRGVPNVTSALLTSYAVSDAWSVSLGYEYVGDRVAIRDPNRDGNDVDRIVVDDHFVLNAAVRYNAKPFTAALNLSNLTDARYFDAVAYETQARGNYAGAPFQALLSVGVEF